MRTHKGNTIFKDDVEDMDKDMVKRIILSPPPHFHEDGGDGQDGGDGLEGEEIAGRLSNWRKNFAPGWRPVRATATTFVHNKQVQRKATQNHDIEVKRK